MDGINPTLAFVALFLGLSGHPRDTVESRPDQTLIAQPGDRQARSGQTTLNIGFGFEKETARRLPWWEWQVWGICPDADPDIEDSRDAGSDIVAEPHEAAGCFSDRQP